MKHPPTLNSKELLKKRYSPKLWCIILFVGLAVPFSAFAQQTVNGSITAADGSPLPGVTVIVKGTTTGTNSDANGRYSITVPDDKASLLFSFIGYNSEEILVGSQTNIDVTMIENVTELGEVVVVGYGTVKKSDLTGAVAVVDNETLVKRGAVNPMEAMQGQIAGVDISNTTGRPGSNFKIQIRGVQSIQGGEPLYVIDGVIVPEGISFLNPQDIERIDILKDASSTAIYGSRGAYGVVLITTKRGSSVGQSTQISYDGFVGVRKPARMPDLMNGDEFWRWRQNSYIADAIARNQTIPTDPGNNSQSGELLRRINEKDYTDWPSLLLQNGRQANHWLALSGRTDKMGYTFGLGYQEEEGNVARENYKRYNFKASIDHVLNDHWSGGANVNIALAMQEKGSPNAMVESFRMNPILSPYDTETGELIVQPGKDLIDGTADQYHINFTSSVNPLIDQKNAFAEAKSTYIIGNVYLQYAPVSWLKAKTTFAPRFTTNKTGEFLGRDSEGRVGGQPKGQLDTKDNFSYVWDNQITANKTMGDHNFTLMALQSANLFVTDSTHLEQNNMDVSAKSFYNIGTTGDLTQVKSYSTYKRETILSFAARLNYAFKDKYLVTLTTRWDGASVLAPGNKWANFPSAAVGWKISEEPFMSNSKVVDNLKLRLSYGFTGNKNVPPYLTSPYASTTTYYDYSGAGGNGIKINNIANQDLTWERTRELDFGVDFSLFANKITGTVDYYNKVSSDLILERLLPMESGWESVYQNVAEVLNKGLEVSLTSLNISSQDFSWTTTFNFAKNHNEVTKLYSGGDIVYTDYKDDDYNGDDALIVGESIYSHYNYVVNGVWQAGETDAALYGQKEGQAKVKDFDDNKIIDESDKRVIGTTLPTWTGGLNSTVTYKGFDFSFSIITRQGVTVYSPFHHEFVAMNDRGRTTLDINYYMHDNAITEAKASNFYPEPKNAGTYWDNNRVGEYRDASFVKVKTIMLGYTLPTTLVSRAGINSLRVYANVLNPFVFTDYDGFDPEWAAATFQDGGLSTITYQFGVNLKF